MAAELEHDRRLREEYGVHINYVRPVQWQGRKVWALGSGVDFNRPPNETFHEFIVELVKQTFGKEWHGAQVASAPGDRHQLMTWFDGLSEVIRRGRLDSRSEVEDGVWSSVPTGDAWALVTFAYDISEDKTEAMIDRVLEESH